MDSFYRSNSHPFDQIPGCYWLLLFDPPPSLDGLGGRPSAPRVASHRGRCVGCVCVCVGVVGEPGGAMAQGGTLAASPEEDRDVGGLSYTCCKQVSPATTWRLLPGRGCYWWKLSTIQGIFALGLSGR